MSLPIKILDQTVESVKDENGEVVPHAYSFASIVNTMSRVYSYRWDEAVKHNRTNALAMRRDTYLRALLQERLLPTTKLNWALEVDDEKDATQRDVAEGLTRCLTKTFRWRRMMRCLLDAVWYGRYGVQVRWSRDRQLGGMYRIDKHKPVNGDKIQYQWDDTPVVMLNAMEANRIALKDKDAIVYTDAGAVALRLYKPEYRDRFVIHQHEVDDADYFEGEMAGAVHGTGLRPIVYWCYWLRQEMLDWMITTMEAIGATELAVVNYEAGNAEAKLQAIDMAKKLPGKHVFIMPRSKGEKYQVVEMVSINTAGVEVLGKTISAFLDVYIERLFVGQTMSADSDGNGLGGSGVASLHADTKYQLLDWDADNLAETLTEQVVGPCQRLNYPWADFPVRLVFSVPNPDAPNKLQTAKDLKELGIAFKAQDVREVTGFARPEDGDEAVGGIMLPSLDGAGGGSDGLDVGGLLSRIPSGRATGGTVDVQELLSRMVQMQADLTRLLTAAG